MSSGLSLQTLQLAVGLRKLQSQFGLDLVSAVQTLPCGHEVELCWDGETLRVERDGRVDLVVGVGE